MVGGTALRVNGAVGACRDLADALRACAESNRKYELMKLAALVGNVEGILDGDGSLEITGIAGLADAEAGDLSFLSNPKYGAMLATTRASAVIVSEQWKGSCDCAVVRVQSPDRAMAMAARDLPMRRE